MTAPTVLLLHCTPDGGSHVDWLVAIGPTNDPESRSLATFRLPARLDVLPLGESMPAEALPAHRNLYLGFEGALSDNRGEVRRIAAGEATTLTRSDHEWRLSIRWTGAESLQRVVLQRESGHWRVSTIGD